jgi:hypothetical protein
MEILWKLPTSDVLEKVRLGGYQFHFRDIKDQLTHIVQSWFNFKTKLAVVYELYFGVMYNRQLYLTNRFLMIVEAFEVYHSHNMKSTRLTKEQEEQYNRIIPEIETLLKKSENISDKDIDQLKTWLRNGIFPSLKTRIEEIYERYSEIIPYLSIKVANKKCFARKVANYRNDLTHGNISSEETDDSELFWTYRDLQLIIELCPRFEIF